MRVITWEEMPESFDFKGLKSYHLAALFLENVVDVFFLFPSCENDCLLNCSSNVTSPLRLKRIASRIMSLTCFDLISALP